MEKPALQLNTPKRTLHPFRALAWLLLRTALLTSLVLASGLYYLKEEVIPAINSDRAVKLRPAPPPLPSAGLVKVPESPPPAKAPAADMFALIKTAKKPKARGTGSG